MTLFTFLFTTLIVFCSSLLFVFLSNCKQIRLRGGIFLYIYFAHCSDTRWFQREIIIRRFAGDIEIDFKISSIFLFVCNENEHRGEILESFRAVMRTKPFCWVLYGIVEKVNGVKSVFICVGSITKGNFRMFFCHEIHPIWFGLLVFLEIFHVIFFEFWWVLFLVSFQWCQMWMVCPSFKVWFLRYFFEIVGNFWYNSWIEFIV